MRKSSVISKISVLSLSLLLASCGPASVASSASPSTPQESVSSITPSTPEGTSEQKPTPSSEAPDSSRPDTPTSEPSTSVPDDNPHRVSEAYWNENITNLGFFKSKQNLTFHILNFEGQETVMEGTVKNDYGKLYLKLTSDKGTDEFIAAPLNDGGYDMYIKNNEATAESWEVVHVSPELSGTVFNTFISFMKPWAFSDFTFNTLNDYYRESDTYNVEGTVMNLQRITFNFTNEKINFFKYDYYFEDPNAVGHFEAEAMDHGKTTVTLPTAPADVPVESIALDKSSLELKVGGKAQLTATVLPDNATNKTVKWVTSDEKIATVVDGLVVGVAEGKATITATAGGKIATCPVQVTKKTTPVVTDNHFAGKVLGYVSLTNYAIMDDTYTLASVNAIGERVTISFFDDGVKDDNNVVTGGSFELYSKSSSGAIEYAYFGKYDADPSEDTAEIELTAYYSGSTGKYYHGDHMYNAKENVYQGFETIVYDADKGMYHFNGYLAKAGAIGAGSQPIAKGQFNFEPMGGKTPTHISGLPEDPHDDECENLIENKVFKFQTLQVPEEFSGKEAFNAIFASSSVSVFEKNYIEMNRSVGLDPDTGSTTEEIFVSRGHYTMASTADENIYNIAFLCEDAVRGYDIIPYTEMVNFVYDHAAKTLTWNASIPLGEGEVASVAIVYVLDEGKTPTPYEVPELPDNWDEKTIAARLTALGFEGRLPKFPGVLTCDVSAIENDAFTVTATLASIEKGSKAYTDYIMAILGEYGFTSLFDDDGKITYRSADGKIVLATDLVTTGSHLVFTLVVRKNVITYPAEGLAALLEEHDVTDPLISFENDAAVGYTLTLEPFLQIDLASDAVVADVVAGYEAALKAAGYTARNMSDDGVLYVSANEQIAVSLMSIDRDGRKMVIVLFLFGDNIPADPAIFPEDAIAAFLDGVTDTYPSLNLDGSKQYLFAPSEDNMASLQLRFAKADDAKTAVSAFEAALVEAGYKKVNFTVDGNPYVDFYLSPNRQLALSPFAYTDESGEAEPYAYITMYKLTGVEGVSFADDPVIDHIEASDYTDECEVGEEYVFDGVINLVYSDGSKQSIAADAEGVRITHLDTSTAGEKTVTIYYVVDGKRFDCTITITVVEPAEEVSCVLACNNDSNWVSNGDPVFRIWVWGGEYGEGAWLTPSIGTEEATELVTFTADIYNNAEGVMVVRFKNTVELGDKWDETVDPYVLNTTDNIVKLAFDASHPYFQFKDAPKIKAYRYICTSNWDIRADSAEFKLWVWGGEYGSGQWLDILVGGTQGEYQVNFAIYNNAAGVMLVRLAPETELPSAPWPEDFHPWNQSTNLLEVTETGTGGVLVFSL